MKKYLVLAGALMASALLLGPGASLRAQDTESADDPTAETAEKPAKAKGKKGGGKVSVEERVTQMTEDLGLDDAQKAKVTEILQTEADELKELRADKEMEKADRQAKMKEIRTNTQAALKAVLTPEQQEKLAPKKAPKGKGKKSQPEDAEESEE